MNALVLHLNATFPGTLSQGAPERSKHQHSGATVQRVYVGRRIELGTAGPDRDHADGTQVYVGLAVTSEATGEVAIGPENERRILSRQ